MITKAFSQSLKFSVQIAAVVTATLFLTHCGQTGMSGSSNCGANVIDTGLSLAVTRIGQNSYRMTLCQHMNNPGTYTVYGANSASMLQQSSLNPASARNPQHIAGAVGAGDSFQVDFLATDTHFAIYMDREVGGTYVLDNQIILVNPHSLPKGM